MGGDLVFYLLASGGEELSRSHGYKSWVGCFTASQLIMQFRPSDSSSCAISMVGQQACFCSECTR